MKKLLYLMMVILPLLSLLMVACARPAEKPGTGATPSTAEPQYGGRLRIMIAGGPGSPIGWPVESVGPSLVYTKACIESLLFEDVNGQIKPWLATEWKISSDQKYITLTLRKGVKFHDGTELNAEAAKFNLQAAKDAKKAGTDVWSSIDVIDDYNIRLNISKFQNTVFSNLSLSNALMISPTSYKNKGIEWARWNPVGTGSFKFNSFAQDVSLKYDKFESYWQKGKPYLDGIDYIVVKDSLTQMAAFQKGEADVLSVGPPKSASELQAMGYQMIYTPTNTVCFIPDSNNADSPFAKKEVREAVEYAINKEELAKALGYGFWIPKYQYAVPSQSVYLTNLPERKYDVNKAKKLLSDAGYPNGFKATIIPDPQSANTDAVTAMQASLKAIGIDSSIETVAVAKFTEYRTKGWKNGLICMAIGVNTPNVAQGMDSNFAATLFPSLKRTPAYLSALDEALAATDFEKQKAATQKALRAMFDDDMVIPIYSGMSCYALQKSVHDTGFLTTGHFTIWAYYNAWLEKGK